MLILYLIYSPECQLVKTLCSASDKCCVPGINKIFDFDGLSVYNFLILSSV